MVSQWLAKLSNRNVMQVRVLLSALDALQQLCFLGRVIFMVIKSIEYRIKEFMRWKSKILSSLKTKDIFPEQNLAKQQKAIKRKDSRFIKTGEVK